MFPPKTCYAERLEPSLIYEPLDLVQLQAVFFIVLGAACVGGILILSAERLQLICSSLRTTNPKEENREQRVNEDKADSQCIHAIRARCACLMELKAFIETQNPMCFEMSHHLECLLNEIASITVSSMYIQYSRSH